MALNVVRNNEAGNAIFFLFIAVALFGMISYALLQGSRGNLGMVEKEKNKAEVYRSQDCLNAVDMAVKRLATHSCGALVSLNSDGTNDLPGGPQDGSCSVFHPNGGAVKPCGDYDPSCMQNLAIGETCSGVVYTGIANGVRIYTTPQDQGQEFWNAGGGTPNSGTGGSSYIDGFANTNALVADTTNPAAPFRAANKCRALGLRWYLPSPTELLVMYDNRNEGDLAGTYIMTGGQYDWEARYWTSHGVHSANAYYVHFGIGQLSYANKGNNYRVRCIRQD